MSGDEELGRARAKREALLAVRQQLPVRGAVQDAAADARLRAVPAQGPFANAVADITHNTRMKIPGRTHTTRHLPPAVPARAREDVPASDFAMERCEAVMERCEAVRGEEDAKEDRRNTAARPSPPAPWPSSAPLVSARPCARGRRESPARNVAAAQDTPPGAPATAQWLCESPADSAQTRAGAMERSRRRPPPLQTRPLAPVQRCLRRPRAPVQRCLRRPLATQQGPPARRHHRHTVSAAAV